MSKKQQKPERGRIAELPPVPDKIRLGVSSCLLGEAVRYDGAHKRHDYLADELAHRVELVPVCPEMECGMGVPRDPMRLVGESDAPRLVVIESNEDVTEQMTDWIRGQIQELEREGLHGFVLKSRSPSCGVRVAVHDEDGAVAASGAGLFAQTLQQRMPGLPVIDEVGLDRPADRDAFLRRVFGDDQNDPLN